jgi:hypothetical protein
MSYSLDLLSDESEDPSHPFGAYLLFVRWSRMGVQKVEGHLETDFLAWGNTAAEAEDALGAMTLEQAKRELDALIVAHEGSSSRRWWDAMSDDGGAE